MKQKIIDLFEYRQFPHLLQYVQEDRREALLEQLIDLQEAVYHLDAVLESKWDLTDADFEPHWQSITQAVIDTGVDPAEAPSYLSNIRAYLKHEMFLRDGIGPHQLDLEEYYFYKSCDVKLTRRLIYENSIELQEMMNLDDWRYFDYITEIDDDTADIVEDHDSINGNGVAFYLYAHGHEEAVRILEGFIHSAKAQSQASLAKKPTDRWLTFINSTAERAYYDTSALLGQLKSVLLHQEIEIAENKTIRLVAQAKKLNPELT